MGYIGLILGLYLGYDGGYIGIMDKKMETTIGLRVYGFG